MLIGLASAARSEGDIEDARCLVISKPGRMWNAPWVSMHVLKGECCLTVRLAAFNCMKHDFEVLYFRLTFDAPSFLVDSR